MSPVFVLYVKQYKSFVIDQNDVFEHSSDVI